MTGTDATFMTGTDATFMTGIMTGMNATIMTGTGATIMTGTTWEPMENLTGCGAEINMFNTRKQVRFLKEQT